ncbi:ABC transporter substrate-binding protein [Clostridium sp.]|uniref:ABC transporter substrate-binding protein n=1 Tax=Clostridium sp. TaxID=1506 RepID=UPI003D6D5D63
MKKNLKLLAVLSALMILSMTGCSNTKSQTATPASSSEEKSAAKAEVLVSRWAGPHADDQKALVKDYSNGKVTIDDVDYGNLKQKQVLSFQAAPGTAGNYDAVWVNIQWIKEYVDAGYLYPVDDLIKAENLDTSIYSKGMMDGCKLDGKTYGIPTYAQCMIIAYDSAVFEKEGQKVPTNLNELIEVAKYFKSKGSGIAMPLKQSSSSFTLWSQLLFSDDGFYFDSNGKLDLTSDKCIAAAAAYDELAKYAVQGAVAWSHDETAEAVRTKIAPIGIIMSGLANQNQDAEKSKIVDTVKYTTLNGAGGKTAANNAFWIWAVPKNATDPAASFKFIKWLTSPEIEKKQTLKNSQISAVESLAKDAEVLQKTPFLPVVMTELSNGKIDPALVNFSKLKDAVTVGMSEIATTNAKPEDVMKKVQNNLKEVDFSK